MSVSVSVSASAIAIAAALSCSPFTSGSTESGDAGSGAAVVVDDGGNTSDGGHGADGGESLPDASGRACAATFCTDFDPPNAKAPFGWDRSSNGLGATPAIVLSTAGRSPPNALQVVVDASQSRPQLSQYLEKDVARTSVTMDVSVRVDQLATSGDSIHLVQVECTKVNLARIKLSGGSDLTIASTNGQKDLNNIGGNTWVRLRVAVRQVSSSTEITLTRLDTNEFQVVTAVGCANTYTIRVGGILDVAPGEGTWKISFDDVEMTF